MLAISARLLRRLVHQQHSCPVAATCVARRFVTTQPESEAPLQVPLSHHPELTTSGWRLNHRIVDCGSDWNRILDIVDSNVETMTPGNLAVAVHRLCNSCECQEIQLAIRSDDRFSRLVEVLNSKATLLSPEHLSDVGRSLHTLGTSLDLQHS